MRNFIVAVSFVILAGGFPRVVSAADRAIESAQGTFDKWVEVQETIAREKRDWSIEREFLNEEVRLLREEIATLKVKSARLAEETGTTEAAIAKSTTETETLKQAVGLVEAELPMLEGQLRRLAQSFPAPLTEQVGPLLTRLPREGVSTKAGTSERLQTVVGLVSQVDKFNGGFTVAAELHKTPAGTEVQVRTLYLGLAQAWFVSPDGKFAGFGKPGAEGWDWTADNDLASSIEKAIAVHENTGMAEYVGLPVSIK